MRKAYQTLINKTRDKTDETDGNLKKHAVKCKQKHVCIRIRVNIAQMLRSARFNLRSKKGFTV